MNNSLAEFLLNRATIRPALRLGVVGDQVELGEAVDIGARVAGDLQAAGLQAGDRIGVIGHTSTEYLLFWIGCQLAGVEPALINPHYPPELLSAMLRVLQPSAVAIVDENEAPGGWACLGFGALRRGPLSLDGRALPGVRAELLGGLSRTPQDIAGYMHTSGTTGLPKFCAQSHRYYIRLGRLVADELALGPTDRVLAPLPLFHINPLGYGVMGALSGLADVIAAPKFSASGFWPTVLDEEVSVIVLHAPPVEILKRATCAEDAQGHRVRAMFFADERFMEMFAVPVGMSCYGSTEAGGLTNVWKWRLGESTTGPEGVSRFGGYPRRDVLCAVDDHNEILVKPLEPGVIFSGYLRDGQVDPSVDEDGWFHTGDLGRFDEEGRLIFIERRSESIRVRGEFVPIDFVEEAFRGIAGIEELAVWKRPSDLNDDAVVLYVVSDETPTAEIAKVASTLPTFMQPSWVARISSIPRDNGAGKVQRRQLTEAQVIEWSAC